MANDIASCIPSWNSIIQTQPDPTFCTAPIPLLMYSCSERLKSAATEANKVWKVIADTPNNNGDLHVRVLGIDHPILGPLVAKVMPWAREVHGNQVSRVPLSLVCALPSNTNAT
jgi:hypothetical protein